MYLYVAFIPILKRFSLDTNEHLARLFHAYLREFIQEIRVGLPVFMLGGESVFLRGVRKKLWVAILSIAILPILPIIGATTAHAVGAPFACDSTMYQTAGGLFYKLNIPAFTYSQIGTNAAVTGLNGMGYNPADNYLYANSNATTLQQIASDGSIISPGAISGLSNTSGGDFLTSDQMLMVQSGSSTLQLLTLNRTSGSVTSATATNIALTGSGFTGAIDIGTAPGTGGTSHAYALTGSTLTNFTLNSSSPTTASYTTKSITGLQNPTTGVYGAQWIDSQGNFYAWDSIATPAATTNALYEITGVDIASGATTIAANKLAETTVPSISTTDGAGCKTAPSAFAPLMPTTATVTNITGTTASATGFIITNAYTVNPLGNENNAKICYNTTGTTNTTPGAGYGLLTGATCVASSTTFVANGTTQNFTVPLTGLTPSTTYYYQAQATNTPGGTITPFMGYSGVQNFVTPGIPTYTSTSPSAGSLAGGTSSTITGTNFTGATSVTIGGVAVTSFVVNSPTSITIVTPAGVSVGAKNVVITAPGGTATGPGAFTYLAQVTFNVNGSGTGTTPPQSGSSLAALTANSFVWTGSTFLGWNTAANGSGTPYANGANYPFTSSTTLYAQWLTVASVAPPSGPLGSTTPITITGTGFTGPASVTIGGVAAASVVVVNSTTITAIVPTGATVGAKDVVVTTPAGTATGTSLYSYTTAVTFNGNGSTGGSTAAQTASAATNLTPNGFIRTGYTFAGWTTVSDGTGTFYADSASFPFAANTTLFAKWTAASLTITYNGNTNTSGTAPTDPSIYGYNSTVTVLGNTSGTPLAKTLYTFAGWNTAAAGTGTQYLAGATFTITANTTLYAQWNQASTITSVASAAAGPLAGGTTSIITGTNFSGASIVTVNGINVTSFVVNSPTQITMVTPASASIGAKNVVITTPGFTVTGNVAGKQFTYQATVTFNGNGSTGGSIAAQSASAATNLTANGFTRTGYTFAGWATSALGSVAYTDGASYPFTADATLFAKWTAASLTITYNGNGNKAGSVPGDPSSPYAYNSTVTVLGNTGGLTKNGGYTFAGWNTAALGTGVQYLAGATFSISANTNLYAQWDQAPTIASVASAAVGPLAGGTTSIITGTGFSGASIVTVGGVNVTSFVVNSPTQITIVTPASATVGAKNVVITTPGGTATGSSAGMQFTYQATVTFNGNGATGGSTTAQSASAATNLTANGFIRTGYTFAGWATSALGSVAYADGVSYPFTADATLWAKWTASTFNVTYNGNPNNGGAVPVDSNLYLYNATVTVLGNSGSLVLTNQTFFGWNTAANGGGTAYAPGATFTMPGSAVTLYVQWTSVTSVSPATGTYNGGTPITITGTNFTGATSATINGLAVTSFLVTSPTTITAVAPAGVTGAAKNVVVTAPTGPATGVGFYTYFATVTFNNNGGTGSMANQTGSVLTALTANTFTRSLYTFTGWATAANGTGTPYANSASYPFAADVTLYAVWSGPPSIT